MAQMTGADVGDLERGAAGLESIGSRIGGMAGPLRSQLYSSHWHGAAAERFRAEWDSVHGPGLARAEEFLRSAGRQLRHEAEQQRHASNAGGGGIGATIGQALADRDHDSEGPSETLDDIRGLLESLGLPIEQIEYLLSRLRLLSELDMLAGPLKALADNEALEAAFSLADEAIDTASLVIDFLTTVADNAHLPMDEAVVLAGATMAVGVAAGAGVKVAAKAIGGLVAGAFSGGTATVVGILVGEVAGEVLQAGFDAADEHLDITENVAQQTLEAYRFAKERDFDPAHVTFDVVREGVGAVVDAGQNFVGEIVDGFNPFD